MVLPTGPNGLHIQWTVDTVVSQTSYNGTIVNLTYPSGTQKIMTVSGFNLTVGELDPATSYSVRLIVQFTGGFQGPPTQASGTTDDDSTYGIITDVITTQSYSACAVSWDMRKSWQSSMAEQGVLVLPGHRIVALFHRFLDNQVVWLCPAL